ncbi:hypothetical protein JL101_035975 (plasmid) [Skermanella rosea]|uniref:hypothetical protein n=1 Tax=Skermanella rosea TaxID=1817965 RepID=UPI0019316B19|nr:hypothetical protein [Skermanella rosea]UEM08052.1 hypothetical protein JL101_035975 [Skermanella rosea]
MTSQFNPIRAFTDASIANGQTTSGTIALNGSTLCGIHMPAAFTGTSLSFQAASSDSGTFQTIQWNGADYSVAVTAGRYVALNPSIYAGVSFLRIVSSASEAAARTLTVVSRPV